MDRTSPDQLEPTPQVSTVADARDDSDANGGTSQLQEQQNQTLSTHATDTALSISEAAAVFDSLTKSWYHESLETRQTLGLQAVTPAQAAGCRRLLESKRVEKHGGTVPNRWLREAYLQASDDMDWVTIEQETRNYARTTGPHSKTVVEEGSGRDSGQTPTAPQEIAARTRRDEAGGEGDMAEANATSNRKKPFTEDSDPSDEE